MLFSFLFLKVFFTKPKDYLKYIQKRPRAEKNNDFKSVISCNYHESAFWPKSRCQSTFSAKKFDFVDFFLS